jgi:hypothetical protein
MKKQLSALLAVLALILGFGLAVPASASADSYCGITWGSLDKAVPAASSSEVVGVRTGRHDCYDRMVIDLNGAAASFSVAYAPAGTPLGSQGSGLPFMTWTGETLAITVYTNSNNYAPVDRLNLTDVCGYDTFRQVSYDSSFEGYTNFGLGVRARLPFRAFALDGRLVIDVAHFW